MLSVMILSLVISQNALDGNLQRGNAGALDSSLQQGSSSNAPRSKQDYRSRNLVVTGDVAGGRGFRGSVGYTAADDFRGATGGETTQAFRANAATTSARALAAIPMNDRFSVATGIGATAYRRDFVASGIGSTAASGAVAGTTRAGWDSAIVTPTSQSAANNTRMQLDNFTRQATTAMDISYLYQPVTVAMTRTANRMPLRMIASPFTGIIGVPDGDLIESLSLGVYGSALMRSDLRSGRSNSKKIARSYLSGITTEQSLPKSDDAMLTGTKLDTQVATTERGRVQSSAEMVRGARQIMEMATPYDRVLATVGNRYKESKGEIIEIEAPVDVDSLRETGMVIQGIRDQFNLSPAEPVDETERLLGSRVLQKPDTAGENASGSDAVNQQSDVIRSKNSQDGVPAENAGDTKNKTKTNASEAQQKRPIRKLNADEAYLLLAHGQNISQLDAGTNEALDTMLRAGDQSMREKRYLTAERAFTSGTLIAPSNPLPLAGMANSQVAAGLQISAATTLRRLFMNWPEMIDVRYGLDILGSAERLKEIAEESLKKSEGSKYESDYGFVAAFIGHQLGDPVLTEKGMALLERNPNERTFSEALRGIWLRPSTSIKVNPVPAPDLAPAPVTGEVRP